MKKHILFALLPLAFAACDDVQEGTEIGGDSKPSVVLYQYEAEDSLGYDPDNTTKLRLAINSAVESLYLLTESEADYKAHYSGDDDAYADYIVANGTKVDVSNLVIDNYVSDLIGVYYSTAVALKGNEKVLSQTVLFEGAPWALAEGTSDYVYTTWLGTTCKAQLKYLTTNPNKYRLQGINYASEGDGITGAATTTYFLTVITDEDGNAVGGDGYRFVSLDAQKTTYSYGDYGYIHARDIATYMEDDRYATSSYGCVITDDNQLILVLDFYVEDGRISGVVEETFGPASESEGETEE